MIQEDDMTDLTVFQPAIAIETPPLCTKVYLDNSQCLSVQKVVLALGNFPEIGRAHV